MNVLFIYYAAYSISHLSRFAFQVFFTFGLNLGKIRSTLVKSAASNCTGL